jgi:hypothetical protein
MSRKDLNRLVKTIFQSPKIKKFEDDIAIKKRGRKETSKIFKSGELKRGNEF